jgi:hypothetical protein
VIDPVGRRTRYRPVMRTVSVLLLLAAALLLAGCGGGGSESGAGDTTATETETAETTETETTGTLTESPEVDIDGSYTGSNAVCKAVTNSSSALNIAASGGQFEVVADEWEKIASEAPADVQKDIATLVKGYRLIDEHSAGFGVLETEPYKSAHSAVLAWTAANCGQ